MGRTSSFELFLALSVTQLTREIKRDVFTVYILISNVKIHKPSSLHPILNLILLTYCQTPTKFFSQKISNSFTSSLDGWRAGAGENKNKANSA